ncbi:hypothetical protein ABIE45_003920 [Methylobacterium sp. OAE515]|uniref:hypothetical protein n=1 Tax=Methylobacterium sp. OAE515 TaxID=2817895 RepID=UPI001A0B58B5
MHKLPPTSIYRLQSLAAAGPRFYQANAFTRRLEVLGLIDATGQMNPRDRTAEYRITEAGRAELLDRYGPSLPAHDDS